VCSRSKNSAAAGTDLLMYVDMATVLSIHI
jgi:hypothetical protein